MKKSKNNLQFLRTTVHNGIMQLLMFTSIPLVVYLIKYRKFTGFNEYVGLFMPNNLSSFIIVLILTFIITKILDKIANWLLPASCFEKYNDDDSRKSFKKQGICGTTIMSLIFTAVITTGLSEEILFRGFITKGLIASLGFVLGNTIQAVIFALPHAVPLHIKSNDFNVSLFEFIRVFIIAFSFGWLMIFVCNGSILPLWIRHGMGNMIGFYKRAFGKEQPKISKGEGLTS